MSLFYNKTLRDSNKNLEHLFGGCKNLSSMFLVLTPSVGVEHFWVDLDGKHVFAERKYACMFIFIFMPPW